MMSKLSVILWLLLFATTCVGQDNLGNNSDKDTLRYKRFDIEEYKRLVRKNPTAYRICKEGKLGELIELEDEYVNNSFAGFRGCVKIDTSSFLFFLYLVYHIIRYLLQLCC